MLFLSVSLSLVNFLLASSNATTDYTVFYGVSFLEENKRYPCIQCFSLPCERDGERRISPAGELGLLCCRNCLKENPISGSCFVSRYEPAVVCKEGLDCDTSKRICVKSRRIAINVTD